MVNELERSQNTFAVPLLETFKKLVQLVPQTQDVATLKLLMPTIRLACRIFFSLNAPGLTPVRNSWRCGICSFWDGRWPALGREEPRTGRRRQGGFARELMAPLRNIVTEEAAMLVHQQAGRFGATGKGGT